MLNRVTEVLNSQVGPIVVWVLGIALAIQVYKLGLRTAGVRHEPWAERSIRIAPVVLGIVTAMAFPESLGLDVLVAGEEVPLTLAGMYGAGAGFSASGAFSAARSVLPERISQSLTVSESS